jgi:hypothetical protein
MADRNIIPIHARVHEVDKADYVLDALRHLAGRVTSPVIRVCLEEAVEEIAHLAACGDGQQEQDTRKEAG